MKKKTHHFLGFYKVLDDEMWFYIVLEGFTRNFSFLRRYYGTWVFQGHFVKCPLVDYWNAHLAFMHNFYMKREMLISYILRF